MIRYCNNLNCKKELTNKQKRFCSTSCSNIINKRNIKLTNEHKARIGFANAKSLLGHIPWNKGLTKETNESVRRCGENESRTKKLIFTFNKLKRTDGCILEKFTNGSHKRRRYKMSKEGKENIRIAARKRISRDGQIESIGKHEKELLDLEEKKIGNPIYRQYYIYKLGLKVDGYDPFLNIVYEVYEKFHKNQIEHDLQRQKEIEDCLGCKFVIIENF